MSKEVTRILVDEINQKLAESPDFERIQYFADFELGEYGAISYYRTQEAREEVTVELQKIIRAHVGASLKGTPLARHYEEYV